MAHIRFRWIAEQVYFRPWLITPQAHHSIRLILESRLAMSAADWATMREREGADISGDKVELPQMVVADGIASIPVSGVLVKSATPFERGSGAVSMADIKADISEAVANPDVAGIFLDVDSPGGMAMGTPELANIIAAAGAEKPVMAWAEGQIASAAYYLASSAGLIYGSETSEVGAIETYLPWIDSSAAYAARGLRPDIIKNTGGEFVATGFPGTSLTANQRAELQRGVDEIFGMYVAHLGEHRPQISKQSMRGQTFIGQSAVAAGLLDAVTTREQALSDLRSWAS